MVRQRLIGGHMSTLTIMLPTNCENYQLFQVLDQEGAFTRDWTCLRLRIQDGWFHPGVLAFLDCWGRQMRNEGRRIEFTGNDSGSLRYLSRMNLFENLGYDFPENYSRWTEAGRFMPLTLIRDSDSVKSAVDALCDLIVRQFDGARGFLPAMEWAVNEVVDNILLHSHTAVSGVVCAQYTSNNLLHIGICDQGRGIRRSLAESHDIANDRDAVALAVQRGITRNPDIGQGNGLAGTHQIISVNGGHLNLWSGTACYVVRNGADTGAIPIPQVPGTGVSITMRTQRPVDLDETFIARPCWTYFDAECQRLNEVGGMRVMDECTHVRSREKAAPIRRKIEALLPDLDDGKLRLDFQGVASPSSSFLDELLAKLVVRVGEDHFRDAVDVVGMTQRVSNMANVVIGQRLGHMPDGIVPAPVEDTIVDAPF